VLLADPNTPAGVDPAAAPMRPPAGRRGRLRRRLRYLRRARELMLRDLGGLLYEIHRTGGGNVEAHGNIVGAKVQRIAGLDAEAHALETALATSHPEAVVFQPGVGGACPACGEYYGSAARFCSNCGAPIAVSPLPAPPMPAQDPTPTPAPATRESVFGRPSQPTQDLSSGDPLRPSAPATDQPTDALGAVAGAPEAERRTSDETAVLAPAHERTSGAIPPAGAARETGARDGVDAPASDEPAAVEAATSDEPAVDVPASDEPAADDAPARDAPAAGDGLSAGREPGVSDEPAAIGAPASDEAAAGDEPAASDEPAAGDDRDTSREPAAAGDAPAASDEPATGDDRDTSREPAAADEPTASDDPAASDPPRNDPPDNAGRNPFAALRNGRTEEDHAPPKLSSGDPLATRDTRS
jgi:hypothetical protein